MTRIRKTIAAKMHESWSTVPRVTNFDDADVTELERIRQAQQSRLRRSRYQTDLDAVCDQGRRDWL